MKLFSIMFDIISIYDSICLMPRSHIHDHLNYELNLTDDLGNVNFHSLIQICNGVARYLVPFGELNGTGCYALKQTACLVVNPITVGNFAFLFN